MNLLSLPKAFLTLAAGLALAAPALSDAREITVVRDRDGDGHYNKKKIEVRGGDRGRYDRGYYGGGYGGRYYGGGSYYGGYPYGYRPYYGPNVGVTYYSRPAVRTYTTYSSDYGDYSDGLAADVQRALRSRGYYRGSIDGDLGPGSRSAIRGYQADHGLPVTGRLDSSLLRALRLD